jgi:hypothetical protein
LGDAQSQNVVLGGEQLIESLTWLAPSAALRLFPAFFSNLWNHASS